MRTGQLPSLLGVLLLGTAIAFGAEWKIAEPGWQYRFPEDHGVHRDFKTEWWYFTGELRDARGREFGYQVTFFREGVRPPGADPAASSRFVVDDIKFAHFAVTDVGAKKFVFEQRTSRGAFGEAGFGDQGRLAWIDGWQLENMDKMDFSLGCQSGDGGVELELESEKDFIIHGVNGISQKANGVGHASHYYSGTRMGTTGRLRITGGGWEEVKGESWFDHEWATNGLTPEQIGWNWFSIQLDDGTELMLYQLRTREGGIDPNSSGTFVAKTGGGGPLARGDYTLAAEGYWKSEATGAKYPIAWKLTAPKLGLELEIRTPVGNQELALGAISYWEGLIKVQGTKGSAAVAGHGYMELTGYAKPLTGMSADEGPLSK